MKITINENCCEETKMWTLDNFEEGELFEYQHGGPQWYIGRRGLGETYYSFNANLFREADDETFRPFNDIACLSNPVKR